MNFPAFLNGAACLIAAAGHGNHAPSRPNLVQALTRGSITVEFDQTPAREAFVQLERLLGIGIVGRYSDDRAGSGIDPSTLITLDATNRAPIEVIERILEQCTDQAPCTWQIRQGYVEVGTKERLSVPAAMEIRVYNIRDLLFEATDFDNAPGLNVESALAQTAAFAGGGGDSGGGGGGRGGGGGGRGGGGGSIINPPGEPPARPLEADKTADLVSLIIATVEPNTWDGSGGPSTISPIAGALVVRAPDFVHRQLAGSR